MLGRNFCTQIRTLIWARRTVSTFQFSCVVVNLFFVVVVVGSCLVVLDATPDSTLRNRLSQAQDHAGCLNQVRFHPVLATYKANTLLLCYRSGTFAFFVCCLELVRMDIISNA